MHQLAALLALFSTVVPLVCIGITAWALVRETRATRALMVAREAAGLGAALGSERRCGDA